MGSKQFTENLYQVFEKDGMQTVLIYFDQSASDCEKSASSFFEKLIIKIPKSPSASVPLKKSLYSKKRIDKTSDAIKKTAAMIFCEFIITE